MTTSFLCSTSRLAFSITISATCTCRDGGSSKVEATTSPRTERCISVTSSGRSSINKTIKIVSGLLAAIDWAMFCITSVLPAFGGETMRARWPFPTGATKSMIRAVRSSVLPLPRSSCKRSFGNSGVKFSKSTLWVLLLVSLKLISSTLSNAK